MHVWGERPVSEVTLRVRGTLFPHEVLENDSDFLICLGCGLLFQREFGRCPNNVLAEYSWYPGRDQEVP